VAKLVEVMLRVDIGLEGNGLRVVWTRLRGWVEPVHVRPWMRSLLWKKLRCDMLLEGIFDGTVVEVFAVVGAVLAVQELSLTLEGKSSVDTVQGFEHVIAIGHVEPVCQPFRE